MTSVEYFQEPVNKGYWDLPALEGFIYHDVLPNVYFSQLKKELNNIILHTNKVTFLTNTSILKHNGQEYKLGLNTFNNRYQNVLYDLSLHPNYWYQTTSTILEWGLTTIKETISPHFHVFIESMFKLKPFNSKLYIPYRLHINYLPHNEGLGVHVDSNHMLYKDEFQNTRHYSVTYYTEDHIEGTGGELYTINGWSFKPKANTAIAMNGHQVGHAVTYNVADTPRLAFTTRWAHIDDLFLPGHPDKHVWKINY